MSGLFRRKSSRRSEGSEGSEPQPGAADAPAQTPAEPGGHESLLRDPAAPAEDTTRVIERRDPRRPLRLRAPVYAQPQPAGGAFTPPPVYPAPQAYAPEAVVPVADLPAGLDPDELAAAPHTSARRGKLRRRVAFLRAAREVLLRDLGGFMYELHRTAHDHEAEAHRRLREIKLERLTRVDAELHELEVLLDDVRRQVLIREPGVGGECPQCGELYGSAAHFCSQCGLPLTDAARRELARVEPVVAAPQPVVTDQPTEEFSPLDPDHPAAGADFQWPNQNPSWTSTPTGMTGSEDPTRVDQPAAFTGAAGESATAAAAGAAAAAALRGEAEASASGGETAWPARARRRAARLRQRSARRADERRRRGDGRRRGTAASRRADAATAGETPAAAEEDAPTAGETARPARRGADGERAGASAAARAARPTTRRGRRRAATVRARRRERGRRRDGAAARRDDASAAGDEDAAPATTDASAASVTARTWRRVTRPRARRARRAAAMRRRVARTWVRSARAGRRAVRARSRGMRVPCAMVRFSVPWSVSNEHDAVTASGAADAGGAA